MAEIQGPVFIVGMPRSGTTLLSTILSKHSLIDISPETHFLAHDWRINQNVDLTKQDCRMRFINSFICGPWFSSLGVEADIFLKKFRNDEKTTFKEIFGFLLKTHANNEGKKIFGEKTPGHYEHVDTLLDWFPHSRVIFMIRDPRSVAASTIDTPFGTGFVNFHARRWARAYTLMKGLCNDRRILPIRYEDLVKTPSSILELICEFIGVSNEPNMAAPSEKSNQENDQGWRSTHHSRARSSIDTTSIDKWKTRLSSGQVRVVEQLCRIGMEEQGYLITTQRFSLLDGFKLTAATFFCRIVLGTRRHFRIWVGGS